MDCRICGKKIDNDFQEICNECSERDRIEQEEESQQYEDELIYGGGQ